MTDNDYKVERRIAREERRPETQLREGYEKKETERTQNGMRIWIADKTQQRERRGKKEENTCTAREFHNPHAPVAVREMGLIH